MIRGVVEVEVMVCAGQNVLLVGQVGVVVVVGAEVAVNGLEKVDSITTSSSRGAFVVVKLQLTSFIIQFSPSNGS